MNREELEAILQTPAYQLVSAAANNNLLALKALLAQGVSIAEPEKIYGRSALHAAADQGLKKIVAFLITAGAPLDALNGNEMTPLMCACSIGKKKGSEIALQLIAAGADVRIVRPGDGMTALKFSVGLCSMEAIQALIDSGADVDGPLETDQTALMLAARANNPQSIYVLLKNGADPNLKCRLPWADGLTAEGLAELQGNNDAINYFRACKD
jgi:ankyrin repeat protein